MAFDRSSTVPRRSLGRHLRHLRERAGISLRAAAAELDFSAQKLSRIEAGMHSVRSLDVRAAAAFYGAGEELTTALVALAKETKSRGWWASYHDAIPSWFDLYLGLEADAARLRLFEHNLVHGLFQTEAYARTVFDLRPGMTLEEAERRIELRLQRQRLLTRRVPATPTVELLLDESVLRRPLPDRGAWTDQLRHLLRLSRLPNVTVRLLPMRLHTATLAPPFAVLDFPAAGGHTEPTTVYAESPTGALYLDRPDETAVYVDIWKAVFDASLVPAESAAWIHAEAEAPE